jgi:hypothetical protein
VCGTRATRQRSTAPSLPVHSSGDPCRGAVVDVIVTVLVVTVAVGARDVEVDSPAVDVVAATVVDVLAAVVLDVELEVVTVVGTPVDVVVVVRAVVVDVVLIVVLVWVVVVTVVVVASVVVVVGGGATWRKTPPACVPA